VEGFGRRSGISTNLELPEHLTRLPRGAETALFRILQEALTNVHRHSGSRAVDVRVIESDAKVILTVKDCGTGVPREILDRFWKTGNTGVGLAGIRERLKELAGLLEIESNLHGTLLRATIPFPSSETKGREGMEPVFMQDETPHALPPD